MEIPKRSLRIDDEALAAIQALPGQTVNDKLRGLLLDRKPETGGESPALLEILELARSLPEDIERIVETVWDRKIAERKAGPTSTLVEAEKSESPPPFNPKCSHCGSNFGSWNRGATVCPNCKGARHSGDVKDCPQCGDYGTGAL